MVKYTGRGLVVKRPGVLSKVQTLDLVLGVGVFSLLPIFLVFGLVEKALQGTFWKGPGTRPGPFLTPVWETSLVTFSQYSMPNMTGRPECQTMEMIGGSSAPYLVRTPCVPSFNRGGNKGVLDYQGRPGDHFHCTVELSPGHIRCRNTDSIRLSGPLDDVDQQWPHLIISKKGPIEKSTANRGPTWGL